MRANVVLNMQRSEGRVITVCMVLADLETSAVCRAGNVSEKYIAGAILQAVEGAVAQLVDKGCRGLQADELQANGSIEVGRPVLL